MVQRRNAESRSRTNWFEAICRVSFELGLLLGALTLTLVALHGAATHHANIDEVVDSSHVRATVDNPEVYELWHSYPLFRFNETWDETIGDAWVQAIDGNRVSFLFNPKKLRWPMGRQGRVFATSPDGVRISLGSDQGFELDRQVFIFQDRSVVASARLTSVGTSESTAKLDPSERPISPSELVGKTVSEWSVATQVVAFNSPMVSAIEVLSIGGVLFGYGYLWLRHGQSPFMVFGPRLAARFHPSSTTKLVFHALLGIPALWLIAEFTLLSISYCALIVYRNFTSTEMPSILMSDSLARLQDGLYFVLLASYEWTLWRKRVSPFALISRRLAFRGGIFGREARELPEHITMWMLQAIIVFTFARLLAGFFQSNLNYAMNASWREGPPVIVPGTNPVSLPGVIRTAHSLAYAFTHAPHSDSEAAMFATIRNLINNICLIGGLFGYGYSVVGYLWGKRVRNLDFTVGGWLVNAVCYGPLLGAVFWHMMPPYAGADPNITAGPFRTTTFVVEAFTNIVYTASIWNLGTMFGVMADKGVRRTGFYSIVRHPSYTIEAFMLILMYSRGLSSVAQWYSMGWFFFMYWIRSERDDQFMGASNPEYVEYRKQVPYKYIPGIY